MKRKWHHPEAPKTGREYWRSLGELEDSEEFRGWLEREFPQGAAELQADDVSRRNFVKLMGAATGLAGFGLAGCSRPVAHLVPFNEHVEWVIPGKALFYASAKPRLDGRGCDPLVVTTHEGRPTKVDGNKKHPMVSGGSDSFTQASVLDLYDPDRSRDFLRGGEKTSAEDFERAFLEDFRKAGSGEGVAFLISENTSPTRARLLGEVAKKYAGAAVYSYDALEGEGLKSAENELFGEGVIQVPRLNRAEKILSLDCDFLGLDKQGEDPVNEFTRGRKVDGPKAVMNRLYSVEPAFTLTGGMADHRLRVAASQVSKVAVLMAAEIGKALGDSGLSSAASGLSKKFKGEVFNGDWIRECAADLVESKGKVLVMAGSRQPKEVHLLAAAINKVLGAFGGDAPVISTFNTGAKALPGIAALAKAIDAGKVKTLFVTTEADPVFDAPADLNVGGLFRQLENVVHLGERKSLTARVASWHVPGAHYLESWGDWQSVTGVYSVQQPMIQPLFGGHSEIDFLLALLKDPAPEPEVEAETEAAPAEEGQVAEATGSDQAAPEGEAEAPAAPVIPGPEPDAPGLVAVKETFAAVAGEDADWNLALRNGFAEGTKFKRGGKPKVDLGKAGDLEFTDLPFPEKFEVTLTASNHTYDGRYANNGWMLEAPDPITKLTWDNAALMSWSTMDELELENGDLIDVAVGEAKVRVPVMRNPGQADYTIQLAAGFYGSIRNEGGDRVETGSISTGTGFNVWPLRSSGSPYTVAGAKVEKTGKKYKLAQTSEHHSMEGRAIVREGTLEIHEEALEEASHIHDHEEKAKVANWAGRQGMDAHIPENQTLYKGPDYADPDSPRNNTDFDPIKFPFRIPGENDPHFHPFEVDPNHQWAMTVDLHACIGCNACTVACQSENNIPIVGKTEVINGREMHWIRMDRYFSSPNDAESVSDRGGVGTYLSAALGGEEPDVAGKRRVDEDQVEMLPQPVACQQCESAPCETVCPVNATVHTSDGLNAMTYNRCIGTRYCANNCPYKARKFNYFDYNKRPLEDIRLGPLAPAEGRATTTELLQKNPNVTVRMRGVIEKCTYCVQRISAAKGAAKAAARDSADVQVPENAITTACQDACPSDAIVFGNLNIESDRVNKMKANPRNYDLLKYIGTLPRTSYLARVKNPNPKMPGAGQVGTATAKMH